MAILREILGPETSRELEEFGKDVDFMERCRRERERKEGLPGLLEQIRSEAKLKASRRTRNGSQWVLSQIAAKKRHLLNQESNK